MVSNESQGKTLPLDARARALKQIDEMVLAFPPKCILEPGPDHLWELELHCDLHGTGAEWTEQFINFVNQMKGYNIDAKSLRFYDMGADPSNPLSSTEFTELFEAFVKLTKGGYGSLQWIPGFKEQLRRILTAKIKMPKGPSRRIKVVFVTYTPGANDRRSGYNRHETGAAQRVTERLINDLAADLKLPSDVKVEVRFVSRPEDKAYIMKDEHIPLLLEDHRPTALRVADTARAVILIPAEHNRIVAENIHRLNGMEELADSVIDTYQQLADRGLIL